MEILVAVLVLSMVLLGLLWMNSFSSRSSMDARFELLATQLALEPIEVFKAFGYTWLSTCGKTHTLPEYPIGTWADILGSLKSPIERPADATLFQREITLTPMAGPPRAILVKVRVAPKWASRAAFSLTRQEVAVEAFVVERPQ